jgi:putative ABC transport system ATP-binding protein
MALLRRLNAEQNLTIVMVTHDQHIAEQADRTITLIDGRVAAV